MVSRTDRPKVRRRCALMSERVHERQRRVHCPGNVHALPMGVSYSQVAVECLATAIRPRVVARCVTIAARHLGHLGIGPADGESGGNHRSPIIAVVPRGDTRALIRPTEATSTVPSLSLRLPVRPSEMVGVGGLEPPTTASWVMNRHPLHCRRESRRGMPVPPARTCTTPVGQH